MDWVKLATNYYLDPAICGLDAESETMFLRALAYCGNAETGGFVPAAIVTQLGRKNANRTANSLVSAGLWVRVSNGYHVRSWDNWQIDAAGMREQWRERQRKSRARRRDDQVDAR